MAAWFDGPVCPNGRHWGVQHCRRRRRRGDEQPAQRERGTMQSIIVVTSTVPDPVQVYPPLRSFSTAEKQVDGVVWKHLSEQDWVDEIYWRKMKIGKDFLRYFKCRHNGMIEKITRPYGNFIGFIKIYFFPEQMTSETDDKRTLVIWSRKNRVSIFVLFFKRLYTYQSWW